MKSLLWTFIKSDTQLDLEANRVKIHAKLRPDEIQYLNEYWGPKESQFLRIHTQKYPNLGAHSNQRSESLHPGTKDILNKQLSIEEATRRLGVIVKSKFRQLSQEEAQNGGAEAAERDANHRQQAAAQEARQGANIALTASFVTGPTPSAGPPPPLPPPPESTASAVPCSVAAAATNPVRRSFLTPDEEEEEEEEEEEKEEGFIPPPSTAPAAMTQSRAGRKRAPTMKALEAEKAPKRGTRQGRNGAGRGAKQ
ncbi:hypothetical protein EPUS_02678 [Endocarpon pusillum Z07020]|uniref:Uncharacterized protein n=1 Tax=Endocarpon pusillum (strain Z07020 / HMAS-L-300199) TaxID=1263415 RepID=U1GXV4_ENDPU|nr:uncharacterized protein EPUS_02678 [Endocarpon pusillum Z07020]ERF76966.1 hypothetical protein EPUS_02678 [Endocarpon pusillum Z07020]